MSELISSEELERLIDRFEAKVERHPKIIAALLELQNRRAGYAIPPVKQPAPPLGRGGYQPIDNGQPQGAPPQGGTGTVPKPLGSDERAALRETIDRLLELHHPLAMARSQREIEADKAKLRELARIIGYRDDGTWSDPPPQPGLEDVPVEAISCIADAAELHLEYTDYSGSDENRAEGGEIRDSVQVTRAWLARREGKE